MIEVVDVVCIVYLILIPLFLGEVLLGYLRATTKKIKTPDQFPKDGDFHHVLKFKWWWKVFCFLYSIELYLTNKFFSLFTVK